MLEQRRSVRSSPSEDKGVAVTMCDEQTTIPIPNPLVLRGWRKKINWE